jgi:hypothetical protein
VCDNKRAGILLATSTQATEAGEGMMEWISVHDVLPEPGETVLEWLLGGGADGLLAPGETMLTECIEGIGVGYNLVRYSYRGQYEQEHVWFGLSFIADSNDCVMSDVPVSHWRRLPEPPKRDGI